MFKISKAVSILSVCLIVMVSLSACMRDTTNQIELEPVRYLDLDGWGLQNPKDAIISFRNSCEVLLKQPLNTHIRPTKTIAKDWVEPCSEAMAVDLTETPDNYIRAWFERNFRPYLVRVNSSTDGLFTGYHELVLEGKRKRDKEYKYPLYGLPRSEEGYGMTRTEIEENGLGKNQKVLYWVKDPVRLFFLHIQGSGAVKLPNGKIEKVGFAGKNRHDYASIGKFMAKQGLLKKEDVTAQSIMTWLYNHPEEAVDIMRLNASYVFFRKVQDNHVYGAQGVPLTPEASIAVDNTIYSYGIPVWIDTKLPNGNPYQKVLIAQDRGGAIRGGVRGDIFFGLGQAAEDYAGRFKQRGEMYLLVPYHASYND